MNALTMKRHPHPLHADIKRAGSMACGVHSGSLEQASGEKSSARCHGEGRTSWENERDECRTEGTATGLSSEDTRAERTPLTNMPGTEEHPAYADDPHQGSAWHLCYDEASKAYYYYESFSGESNEDSARSPRGRAFHLPHLQYRQHTGDLTKVPKVPIYMCMCVQYVRVLH